MTPRTVAMAAVVPRLSATPGAIAHSGHRIGQDTRRVLARLLGYSDARLDTLAAAGVITGDISRAAHAPDRPSPTVSGIAS